MRFEYWFMVLAILGIIGNIWIIRDCKKINSDPNSCIIVENPEVTYVFLGVSVWLLVMAIIRVIWF